MIFGAWMMGQALAFAPNFNAARISAGRIFYLFDRMPKIISPSDVEEKKNWVRKVTVVVRLCLVSCFRRARFQCKL